MSEMRVVLIGVVGKESCISLNLDLRDRFLSDTNDDSCVRVVHLGTFGHQNVERPR